MDIKQRVTRDSMQAHQQRVVIERDELQIKFLALGKFLTSDKAPQIDPEERSRLSIQYSIMNAYLQMLELRIREF